MRELLTNPRDSSDTSSTLTDQTEQFQEFLDGIESGDDNLHPIEPSDARQLGEDVALYDVLPNLAAQNTWQQIEQITEEASDDELLALGALSLAGIDAASSFSSTPVKAGRHGDTSREYDDGFSRHAGAAINDAVLAGRAGRSDGWTDAYYDSERRQLSDGTLNIPDESLADLQRTAQAIDRAEEIAAAGEQQARDAPAAEATQDLTEARAAIALQLKQDKGIQKLIESKAISLKDILDDDGTPDLQKLNRLRDMIRDETSRASDSYVKAATVQRSAPQPILGYNPTVPGYRRVNGTKYFVWQPARYADSVPT